MDRARHTLVWGVLFLALAVPVLAAAGSPLLAWREPIYILAGFAGIAALCLLLVQPLLIGGYLPGLSAFRARRIHRWVGGFLVLSVIIHVGGLWITSPPDVIDALLFVSPTPFSVWGVTAMWAIFAAAFLAAFRKRLGWRPRTWRRAHTSLALVIIAGTILHALLIEGAMETVTKVVLCALVAVATLIAMADLRVWSKRRTAR